MRRLVFVLFCLAAFNPGYAKEAAPLAQDEAVEKRMVVILREDQYDAWLSCDANAAEAFMKQFPADQLVATPDPERGRRSKSAYETPSEGL